MDGDPLAGIVAKLQRGFDHLNELDSKMRAFLLHKPYAAAHEPDDESGWHVARFRVYREPPVEFGIIAGEAVGQFRSALDHLVMRLVRLKNPASSERVIFPIYGSLAEFTRVSRNGDSPCRTVRKAVRRDHYAILKRLQPYRRRHPSAIEVNSLSQLKRFSNVDKHDSIHPAYAMPTKIQPGHNPDIVAFEWEYGPPYVLDEGTRLYRVKFRPGAEVKVPILFSAEIVFGPAPKYAITTRILGKYGLRAAAILDEFRAVTPEFQPKD